MKANLIKIVLLLFIIPCSLFSFAHAATMNDYCDSPPSLSSAVAPNIFLVIDASGSMSWPAYYDYWAWPSPTYNSATTYEGYFTPTKNYKLVSGVWTETTDVESCSGPTNLIGWYGLNVFTISGTCSGNKLNFSLMSRIDVVRWAITGGTPTTCTGTKTFNSDSCDTELWQQSGMNGSGKVGTVCDSTGCRIMTDSNLDWNSSSTYNTIKIPWSRINDSLSTTFKGLSVVPRMGGFFFSSAGVRSDGKIYAGDFTGPNSTSASFPFKNLITGINSSAPSGGTPTGPAMWDAYNYFAQNAPQYGGIPAQSGSGDRWKNPIYVCDGGGSNCVLTPCAKNFVMLLSDGQWNTGAGGSLSCSIDTGYENASTDPVVPAYKMHMGFTNAGANVSANINAVYTIGLFLGGTGATSLKNVAMYGSFDKTSNTWPDSRTDYPKSTCTMDDCGSGKGSGCTDLPASSSDWDSNADNVPDTYYNASNASAIKDAILNAVLDALRRASSGTAASMLSTSQGSGATLLQAVFYPKRTFGTTEISWTGGMQNLWYYLDPSLNNNTIREDTNNDKKLNIVQDYKIEFVFDTTQNKTRAKRYSDDGNGNYTYKDTVDLESLNNLWEAGSLLWARDVSSSPRTVYTTTDGATLLSGNFSAGNASALQSYLQAADAAEAAKIINYVLGTDQSGYRNRTVSIGGVSGVWKLGDIISSTPRMEASSRLNTYHLPNPQGYNDSTYATFINSLNYKTRGMAYAGANDGMLHAFKLGTLDVTANGYQKATLCDDTDGDGKCDDTETSVVNLGKEQWAFIPKNALPYLKYLSDPNYCHLYYVDGPLSLFDASIAVPTGYAGDYWDSTKADTSWRTIMIGSMGMGGACRDTSSTCTDCVKTPVAGNGFSSYFAFDVTDPQNPVFLWEFSNAALGFSMAGPAIIKISPKKGDTNADSVIDGKDNPDNTKNGRWYAVFASGPTGPIDTTAHQFQGKSDQNLKLFVVDLKTGALLRTIDTGIQNAFATSFFNSPIDTERWNSAATGYYQDNVFYLGYVKKTGSTWTDGGVLRVMTKEDDPDNGATNWVASTVIDGIGPVTTSISKLQDRTNGHLWLYFGTGRFFYKTGTTMDDADSQRTLYGIKEPCYGTNNVLDNACTTSVSAGSLTNQTINPVNVEPSTGWYINLAASGASYKAERVITDPLATPSGAVFFTTFSPNSDVCSFGGSTYIWAVGYNTGSNSIDTTSGGSAQSYKSLSSVLKGKAMIQVSTGSIQEISLGSSFTQSSGRQSAAITGMPPKGQGLSVVINPQPIKKILHIKEK